MIGLVAIFILANGVNEPRIEYYSTDHQKDEVECQSSTETVTQRVVGRLVVCVVISCIIVVGNDLHF